MDMKEMPRIGAHVKATGGPAEAVRNALALGAEAIQMYGASPRMWHAGMPSEKNVHEFRLALTKSGITEAYLHAAYLVNLASPDEEIYKKSIANLSAHLRIAEALGVRGLIFHVGSGKGSDSEEALKKEAKAMKRVLKDAPGKAWLVMENSAGGGAKIGSGIEEMQYLFEKVNSPRLKICFDTAHAFEAGLVESYTPENIKNLFDAWDDAVGLATIVTLHVNDSKTAYASHHDRHENIGEGYIGLDGFKALAKEKRLWNKTWLLEVPGFEGEGPDKKNIDIVRSLFDK